VSDEENEGGEEGDDDAGEEGVEVVGSDEGEDE
jgi:hypothetical protein